MPLQVVALLNSNPLVCSDKQLIINFVAESGNPHPVMIIILSECLLYHSLAINDLNIVYFSTIKIIDAFVIVIDFFNDKI